MNNRWRYGLGAFAVAAILAGVGIGIAVAGDGPSAPAVPQAHAQQQASGDDFLARLAEKLGVSEEQLRDALGETVREELESAAARGLLPADAARSLADLIDSHLSGTGPASGTSTEEHALGGLVSDVQREIEALEREVAAYLGTTEARLRELVGEGKSLGEIADSLGKSRDGLTRLLVTRFMAFLEDERVPAPLRDLARAFAARLVEMYVNGDLSIEEIFGGALPWAGGNP